MMLYITLMFYDDDNYTKVVYDAVLAEEEAECLLTQADTYTTITNDNIANALKTKKQKTV